MTLSLVFSSPTRSRWCPRAQLQTRTALCPTCAGDAGAVVKTSSCLVVAARAGLGYWSLVVNTLAGAVAATVL